MMNADPVFAETIRAAGAALRDTPWGPIALDFGDWESEYRAFRETAGLFHPPSAAQVEITGSQRAEFLNRLATNKLDQIQPGEGCETFFCDANGRIVHHVFVFAGPKSLVLHTAAGLGTSLLAHLDHFWIREDLGFHDRSDEWGEVILAGPQAAGIIERLTSSHLSLWERALDAAEHAIPSPPAPLPMGEGSYLSNYDRIWNGRPLAVRRWRERGFDSFHLAANAAEIGPLWRALRELGAKACGMRALEAIRIEEGFPVIGVDITEKNLPQEVGRNEKAISFTKGCYLGQEIVARIDSRGAVAKVLSGLRFESSEVPASGEELLHEGQPAGQITSAAYSPGFKASVALAYIRRPFHEPGVVLDSPWGKATVVELPMR